MAITAFIGTMEAITWMIRMPCYFVNSPLIELATSQLLRRVEIEEDNAPMLEEEIQIEDQAEGLVIEARDEEEEQQQEYTPYQLTLYYRNQLEQFEGDYIRWEANQYHLHYQHFKETMAQRHERALLLLQHNLPVVVEEEDDVERIQP
jgi:hypothetical protein